MNPRKRFTAVLGLIALMAMLAAKPAATAIPVNTPPSGFAGTVMSAASPALSLGWLPTVSSVQAPAPGFTYVGQDDIPDRSARTPVWPGFEAGHRLMRVAGELRNFPVRLRKAGLLFPFHDFW